MEQRIDINAPVSRVWRALTNHAEFGAWFGVKLDGPFAVGETSTGTITTEGCGAMKWSAVVRKMDAQKLFSYTWHPYAVDAKADYSKETPTLVEFRLEPIPTGTRLTVTESGFDKVPAARRAEAFRKHNEGWAEQMNRVQVYVTPA